MVHIPTDGPPTHPGEMLLEEFLKPLGMTRWTSPRKSEYLTHASTS